MSEPMRRKDREITDPAAIDEIIRRCYCCRLGLLDGARAYVVPLSFGYERDGDRRVFYFHTAGEGRKLRLLSQNACAAFELDTGYELARGQTPCACGARYQCVMGEGRVFFVTDPDEKREALASLMRQTAGWEGAAFGPEALAAVTVLRLEVTAISAKARA